MSKINCELLAASNAPHLQQIYAGFGMLHAAGAISLKQRVVREKLFDESQPPHLQDARENHLKAVINDCIRLYYDAHDGAEIDREQLSQTDFYFKRSYSPAAVDPLPERRKIFPLGLNYLVYGEKHDSFLLTRHALYDNLRDKTDVFTRALRLENFSFGRVHTPRLADLSAPPDFGAEPRVLFMARLWNPEISPDAKIREQIKALNETRAACVRLLRQEFKIRFFGGLAADEYSRRHFPDCLLADDSVYRQRNYLQKLREFPVCVATTGLLGSIGWKFGEYVALAKAIVTEPLCYRVPGDFQIEQNYLQFESPEKCVAAVGRLFEEQKLRLEMMRNNFRYYRAYVRPDALVLNTLATALTTSADGLN